MVIMDTWMIVGFLAQGLFFGRFFIQWIVSEYKEKVRCLWLSGFLASWEGACFWYMRFIEKILFLSVGQAGGLMSILENLMLIYQKKQKMKKEVKKIETHVNS
jgi:lipid-A-disaccharide synthase-like uncharacterized protein